MDHTKQMDGQPCKPTTFTLIIAGDEEDFIIEDSSEMGCFGPMLSTRGIEFLKSFPFPEIVAINGRVEDGAGT